MSDFGKILGERIRSIRRRKGYSQEELGFRASCSTSFISDIERGEKSPTIETLHKITDALDVSLEEFFFKFQPKKKSKEAELIDAIIGKVNNLSIKELETVQEMVHLLLTFRSK